MESIDPHDTTHYKSPKKKVCVGLIKDDKSDISEETESVDTDTVMSTPPETQSPSIPHPERTSHDAPNSPESLASWNDVGEKMTPAEKREAGVTMKEEDKEWARVLAKFEEIDLYSAD